MIDRIYGRCNKDWQLKANDHIFITSLRGCFSRTQCMHCMSMQNHFSRLLTRHQSNDITSLIWQQPSLQTQQDLASDRSTSLPAYTSPHLHTQDLLSLSMMIDTQHLSEPSLLWIGSISLHRETDCTTNSSTPHVHIHHAGNKDNR